MPESKIQLLTKARDGILSAEAHLQALPRVILDGDKRGLNATEHLVPVRSALYSIRGVNAALQGLEQRLLGLQPKEGD